MNGFKRSKLLLGIISLVVLAPLAEIWAFPGTGRKFTPTSVVNLVISANTQNYNIFTAAGSPAGVATVTVTINSGVIVGSSGTSAAALVTGSGWASGSTISIVNNGKIIGAGGAGGTSTGGSGSPGGLGGPAINLTYPVTITNGSGNIYGGGGGGGGGGGFVASDGAFQSWCVGGGGGGGGAGSVGGALGSATIGGGCTVENHAGTNGGAGSTTGGSGGAGYDDCALYSNGVSGSGGAGGGYGASGTGGGCSSAYCEAYIPIAFYCGGAGGAAGNAITKNGNAITWISGSSSPNVLGAVL